MSFLRSFGSVAATCVVIACGDTASSGSGGGGANGAGGSPTACDQAFAETRARWAECNYEPPPVGGSAGMGGSTGTGGAEGCTDEVATFLGCVRDCEVAASCEQIDGTGDSLPLLQCIGDCAPECVPQDGPCTSDAECCDDHCDANGTCTVVCQTEGTACESATDCCDSLVCNSELTCAACFSFDEGDCYADFECCGDLTCNFDFLVCE